MIFCPTFLTVFDYVFFYNITKIFMGKRKTNKKFNEDDDYIIYTENNRRRKASKKSTAAGSWSMR